MGNVLISERPENRLRGFLHDFDYSWMTKEVPPPLDAGDSPFTDPLLRVSEDLSNEDLKEQTVSTSPIPHYLISRDVPQGTYYFMSHKLLFVKDTIHTVHHDLESFYWVLLWIVLRHTYHDYQGSREEPDPCARVFVSGDDWMAGAMKLGWILDPELHITFTGNEPLTDLMHQFRLLIWRRSIVIPNGPERQYLTHAAVLELFDQALARTDWPDAKDDAAKPYVKATPVPARMDQPRRQVKRNADDLDSGSTRSHKQRRC